MKTKPSDGITVDISQLTIGDLELLDQANSKTLPMKDMLDLLDRVVVGGARHLPITMLDKIMQAVQAEVEQASNPQ